MQVRTGWFRLLAALLFFTAVDEAPAAEPHRLAWRTEWRGFQWSDAVTTAATTSGALVLQFAVAKPEHAHWEGPILFDRRARQLTVGADRETRESAVLVGDVMFYGGQALPFIDSVVAPTLGDDANWEIAWQLTAMNIQATSLVLLLARAGHRFVGRARPDVRECAADPDYHANCGGGPYASFPSGHVAAALAGAGLMCAHHQNLPLWGDPTADELACVVPLAMGITSGVTRLIGDRHYLSDVSIGATLGFGIGYGMPMLLHYRPLLASDDETGSLRWVVIPSSSAEGELGLAVSGVF